MKKATNFVLVLTICISMNSCFRQKSGFFEKMPTSFLTDSLTVQNDLFESINIQHTNGDEIKFDAGDYCNVIPFCGFLMAKNGTIYYKKDKTSEYRPYLKLGVSKFDTTHFVYSNSRIDNVVAMGKMMDSIFKDSIHYFQLLPVQSGSPHHNSYVRYVAIKNGGIRYLTFKTYSKDYTILLKNYPKVVWSSQ